MHHNPEYRYLKMRPECRHCRLLPASTTYDCGLTSYLVSGIAKVSSALTFWETYRTVQKTKPVHRQNCTAIMDGDASTMSEKVQNMEQLKPIHIVVMVLTLLHAIAIAVWSFVFLTGSKSEFQAPLAMCLCFYIRTYLP